MWIPVRRYRVDRSPDATAFPTGRTIDIYEPMIPGRPIKVVYFGSFSPLVNPTDTMLAAGMPDSMRDVLVYGAAYRMLASLESARVSL